MASIGLKHFVFAKGDYTGSTPSYSEGKVVGKAIEASISLSRNSATLYADDALVESDVSVNGGTLTGNVDDLDLDEECLMFGVAKNTTDSVYSMTDADSPYGGCGYVVTTVHEGVRKYIGYWIHKIQFGMTDYTAQTKGSSTDFATPKFEGQMHGVELKGDGVMYFFDRKEFNTVALATAWVDGKAGISSGT